jgi:hypothetical protein
MGKDTLPSKYETFCRIVKDGLKGWTRGKAVLYFMAITLTDVARTPAGVDGTERKRE